MPADDAELVALGHQSGQHAAEEGALLLAEEHALDIRRLGDRVDEEEVLVGILVGNLGDRLGEQEPNADGEVALLRRLGQVRDVRGRVAALDHLALDAELLDRPVESPLRQVVEVLVAEPGGVRHHRDDDRILGVDGGHPRQHAGNRRHRHGGQQRTALHANRRDPGRHGRSSLSRDCFSANCLRSVSGVVGMVAVTRNIPDRIAL